jgi:hypothetical protein
MDCRALAFLLVVMPALSGCMRTAWEHYDECAATGSSFQAMAACGKAKRIAYCTSAPVGCSDTDNSFVQFADALSRQVANREMSDAEAMRRYVEYKTAQQNAQHQIQAASAARAISAANAASAASRPVFCQNVGVSMVCN